MKKIILLAVCVLALMQAGFTQVTYTSANFGVVGDSLFYTKIKLDTNYGYNYAQAGVNQNWNFSGVVPPTTQFYDDYLNPKTAGYKAAFITGCEAGGGTVAQCNTRFNNLTNLAFNNFDTLQISNLRFFNQVTMDNKTTGLLEKEILGFTTRISGVNVPFTATYITPDVVRVFPLAYGNADSSVSAYDIDLTPYGVNFVYHAHSKRVNHVDAWGAITTPYATYSSSVREYAVVYHYDTLFYDNSTIVITPSYTFEYAWFDPAFTGPVFTASGNLVNGTQKFTTVEYLDTVHCLPPTAAEHHQPILPVIDPSVDSVTVNFTNLSQNANSYSWNFGDPGSGAANTSTATDPIHAYTDSGIYTITLIACNTICIPEKCDTETFKLRVDDSLEIRAGFTAHPNTTCVGDTVTFENNSVNATSYFWNFGDLTTSTLKDPTHVYATPGTYTVELTASNGSAIDTAKRVVTVQAPPSAAVHASGPLTFCNGDSVILSASGGTTYQWSNGHIGANLTVRTSGTYTVKVINSCGSATSAPITVVVNTPVDTLTLAGDTAICSGDSVELLANTGTGLTYQWRRDGQIITGANQSNYYAKTAGNYVVNVTQNGCRGVSNAIRITVTNTPAATISVQSSTVICSGDSVKLIANAGANLTYQWQLAGNNIPGATNSTYYAKTGGSYTAVVARGACTATSNSIILTVNQTPAPSILPNNGAFCSGDSLYLSTGTGLNYTFQWLSSGSPISGATNEFYYAKAAGNYKVAVTANGCTGISPVVTVIEHTSPTADAGFNQNFTACTFTTITLGGESYRCQRLFAIQLFVVAGSGVKRFCCG
jgi:PKD repeat protein